MALAIEQMKYVSILGPIDMFDEFVLKHIINSNVQLEPAYKTLNMPGLIPFNEDSSLDNLRKRMKIINEKFHLAVKKYDADSIDSEVLSLLDSNKVEDFIESVETRIVEHRKDIEHFKTCILEKEQIINQILPVSKLNVNIDEMFHFSFMKFRFGYLPKVNYSKQKNYINELDVVVVPVNEDNENLWLSYFMPASVAPVIDNVFSAIGFTRVRISDQAKGTPKAILDKLNEEIKSLKNFIEKEEMDFNSYLEDKRDEFDRLYQRVLYLSKVNEVKRLSSHTQETFFMVGWIPYKDYKKFVSGVESMKNIMFSSEDPDYVMNSTPPTIMRNNSFFKPFESLITMYGLPSAK